MNKVLAAFLMIVLVFSSLGCGSGGKSAQNAFKMGFKDDADPLPDSPAIQEALFSYKWEVTSLDEFVKRITPVLKLNGAPDNIQINAGIYDFNKNTKHEIIEIYCLIGEDSRVIKIDCGQVSVETSRLKQGDNWYISLYDENNNEIKGDAWAWRSFTKNQVSQLQSGKKFVDPYITYATVNYIIFQDTNITLKSFKE